MTFSILQKYMDAIFLRVSGFIRSTEYTSGIAGISDIKVQVGPIYTVIRVNGIALYIDRLTGIDGTGSGHPDPDVIDQNLR